jgi:hypothetical protein
MKANVRSVTFVLVFLLVAAICIGKIFPSPFTSNSSSSSLEILQCSLDDLHQVAGLTSLHCADRENTYYLRDPAQKFKNYLRANPGGKISCLINSKKAHIRCELPAPVSRAFLNRNARFYPLSFINITKTCMASCETSPLRGSQEAIDV